MSRSRSLSAVMFAACVAAMAFSAAPAAVAFASPSPATMSPAVEQISYAKESMTTAPAVVVAKAAQRAQVGQVPASDASLSMRMPARSDLALGVGVAWQHQHVLSDRAALASASNVTGTSEHARLCRSHSLIAADTSTHSMIGTIAEQEAEGRSAGSQELLRT